VSDPVETALLVTVPAAEPVVGRHRSRLDRAARVGVPAHVTVVFPFVPFAALGAAELAALTEVARAVPAFTLELEQVGWFGEEVVFLRPDPSAPVLDLVARVGEAFPDFPPYAGAHDEVVPHLTVGHLTDGHGHTVEDLRVAEAAVVRQLPVTQRVEAISLWAGPPLLTEEPGWRQVGSFPLG
jgi:2'-5' RNA ligase